MNGKTVFCSRCDQENPEDVENCIVCGTLLPKALKKAGWAEKTQGASEEQKQDARRLIKSLAVTMVVSYPILIFFALFLLYYTTELISLAGFIIGCILDVASGVIIFFARNFLDNDTHKQTPELKFLGTFFMCILITIGVPFLVTLIF